MAEYLIKDTTLTEIANAVRAKTKKTDTILVSDMADEISKIFTDGELNFKVVGGTTKPENPTKNTIWVNTNNNITGYAFSTTEPENTFPGLVWITTFLDSKYSFNILTENTIKVYPGSVKQYIGNTWVERKFEIHDGTSWKSPSLIPDFTYTGDFQVVNDNDEPIETSNDNWKIRFLTSGTLILSSLNGAADGIDVFCVGGGGGGNYSGGGGGYTTTQKNVMIELGNYEIVVGAGGGLRANGGTTTAFNVTANGGRTANGLEGTNGQIIGYGGNGGSGGGASYGGSDGSNGGNDTLEYATLYGGTGQHTTTREFAETGARLYSGGGGGQSGDNNSGGAGGGGTGSTPGGTNTGGGGGYNSSGGSGIVVIRNKRG